MNGEEFLTRSFATSTRSGAGATVFGEPSLGSQQRDVLSRWLHFPHRVGQKASA